MVIKNFGMKYKRHKFSGVMFEILKKLQNDVMIEEKQLHKFFSKRLLNEVSKNWVYLRKITFNNKKILDFVPEKYHKQYEGLERFFGAVWNIDFNAKLLKIERTFHKTYPIILLLIVIKRIKVFIPKRLFQYLISFI